MRHTLCAVHDDNSTIAMRHSAYFTHRCQIAKHIADVCKCNHTHTLIHHGSNCLQGDASLRIQRHILNNSSAFLCNTHPRQHARSMLRHTGQNDIAPLQKLAAIAVCHQIQSRAGSACINDFPCIRRMQKGCDILAGLFIFLIHKIA